MAFDTGLPSTYTRAIWLDTQNNQVYVSVEDYGVYVSPIANANWQSFNTGLRAPFVTVFKSDLLNDGMLLAGTDGGGVYKSVRYTFNHHIYIPITVK